MIENRNTLAYCILAGLLAVAISLPVAVGCYTSSGRKVSVRGLCEKEVRADRVIWPIEFVEGGNSLSSLATSTEKKNLIVQDWLKSSGIQETEISVSAPKVEDRKSNGYQNYGYDYVMKSVITVCTSDIDKVLSLQASQFELINKGIAIAGNSWEYPTIYEYTGLNEIKPQMIEDATLNARAAAEKFAKDSGSKVGKILNASQGQFSITDRDANTPYIKTVRVVTTIQYQLK